MKKIMIILTLTIVVLIGCSAESSNAEEPLKEIEYTIIVVGFYGRYSPVYAISYYKNGKIDSVPIESGVGAYYNYRDRISSVSLPDNFTNDYNLKGRSVYISHDKNYLYIRVE